MSLNINMVGKKELVAFYFTLIIFNTMNTGKLGGVPVWSPWTRPPPEVTCQGPSQDGSGELGGCGVTTELVPVLDRLLVVLGKV